RRVGRQLTYGPGVPYIPAAAWREYMKNYTPGRKLLGDVENWEELEASQSIIVGSPETVTRRIKTLLGKSRADVAPRLRETIHRGISRHQPRAIGGGSPLSGPIIDVDHRKVQ